MRPDRPAPAVIDDLHVVENFHRTVGLARFRHASLRRAVDFALLGRFALATLAFLELAPFALRLLRLGFRFALPLLLGRGARLLLLALRGRLLEKQFDLFAQAALLLRRSAGG